MTYAVAFNRVWGLKFLIELEKSYRGLGVETYFCHDFNYAFVCIIGSLTKAEYRAYKKKTATYNMRDYSVGMGNTAGRCMGSN